LGVIWRWFSISSSTSVSTASFIKSAAGRNSLASIERSAPLSPSQHAPHRQVRLLGITARSVGLAERPQHLLRSACGDDKRVGLGRAEDVEGATDVVIRMKDGRRQMSERGDRAAVVAVFEHERMRLRYMDLPLVSPISVDCDNDIGAAERIGFAEGADRL